MSGISTAIEKAFKAFLPAPFTIAIFLTLITILLSLSLTGSDVSGANRVIEILGFWEKGLWNPPLMVFAMQMMLMLVLGHTLALTKPVDSFIGFATKYCNTTAASAAIVTLLTVTVALFNWGLGLIFGAILARKVGERAAKNAIDLNYPLIGAAGYSGLMVWHGGISGSAPIKAAEAGHIHSLMNGIVSTEALTHFPDSVSFSETVFSTMNLTAITLVLVVLPAFMYIIGKRVSHSPFLPTIKSDLNLKSIDISGAERLDHSKFLGLTIGFLLTAYCVYKATVSFNELGLGFINPNYINLVLLSLCLLLHQSFFKFLNGINDAISGASGILIQFPLYFGIMGIMNSSGLVQVFSDFFVGISNETTFPIFTFISAGIVNVFVPSGGGQWGVQGPIILQTAAELGVSIPKCIMALSYGDQLTNMLQPFWALPLLGITGLKAKEILPYTVALMVVGAVLFIGILLVF